MQAINTELEQDVDATLHTQRQQVLQHARRLDTLGRQTEQFLCQQLNQLEQAISEFEAEKAAWRRQFQRESQELARQREDIRQLMESHASSSPGTIDVVQASARMKRNLAEADARMSGANPLRFFIQPGKASTMQVGLLLFEISKLNRDLGGHGLRFEIEDIRTPRKRFFSSLRGSDCDSEIVELTLFSTLPLTGRGAHVSLDVDATDRIEDWITFKSHVLQSSLLNSDLVQVFRNCKSVKHDGTSGGVVKKAARRAEGKCFERTHESDYPSPALWANTSINAVQQQVSRMENCYERLTLDCGLFVHIEIHSLPTEKIAE